MTGYFGSDAEEPARRTYAVDEDLLAVLAADSPPEHLRELARSLGVGSAFSSPPLLQRDLVNYSDDPRERSLVGGPAVAALLGGSVSEEGQLEATGITFSVSGGIVGFVTFAIPAALLVPGGGFYVAYRLYRLLRDTAALRRYARVSQAAPHVAIAVAACDHEITRDEARLLRDLLRGRVGSRAERYGLLKLELDPSSKQEAALAALAEMNLEPDDWSTLLSIAIATAHADDEYSGEERELIGRFRELTTLSDAAFGQLAAEAEADYISRCHLAEAMIRACAQIARAGAPDIPEDAAPLLDLVMCGAIPGDNARTQLARRIADGLGAMEAAELLRGASDERPSIFQRVAGARSESEERAQEFGRTMALFLATLEQWRGWVVRDCRAELFAIGKSYGLGERQLGKWLRAAHKNIEQLRAEWVELRPWEASDEQDVDFTVPVTGQQDAFGVTGLPGGRFVFRRQTNDWEWRSGETHFDEFVRNALRITMTDVVVHTDDMTFEVLTITIDAQDADTTVRRGG